jgi:hypothetical protein
MVPMCRKEIPGPVADVCTCTSRHARESLKRYCPQKFEEKNLLPGAEIPRDGLSNV